MGFVLSSSPSELSSSLKSSSTSNPSLSASETMSSLMGKRICSLDFWLEEISLVVSLTLLAWPPTGTGADLGSAFSPSCSSRMIELVVFMLVLVLFLMAWAVLTWGKADTRSRVILLMSL